MAEDAGSIEYTVDVKTQASIDAAKKASDSIDGMESSMNQSDKTATKLSGKMKGLAVAVGVANKNINAQAKGLGFLKSALGGVVALLGTKAIIDMADQYTEAASRIREVAADTEEYELIQRRLLETANKTYRPLQEAQEVYIRTSKAIKDLGYNTSQALDITDSFSFLLVTNAASAERAGSAINGYSKAIQTGKIDSQTWQSILAAMPTVVADIANATGETESRIRELGITGKLSLEALNEALLRSRDTNQELADAMDTTVGDAVVALKNSLQVFIAEVNNSSGATNSLVTVIETLALKLQDPSTIAAAQELAAGVAGAFLKLIEVMEKTTKVAGFLGESLAAAIHGPELDDIVRMTDKISELEEQARLVNNELSKTRVMRINPFKSDAEYNAELNKIISDIELYKNAIDEAQKSEVRAAKARNEAALENEKNAAKQEEIAKKQLALVKAESTAQEEARLAEKERLKQKREAEKLAEKLLKAEQDNIKVLDDLKEAIYQTTLNADQLAQRQAELMLNEYATPEQKKQVQEMALELKKLNAQQELAAKVKDAGGVGSYVRGDVQPISGGVFDDGTQRYDDEAQKQTDFYASQVARLIDAREQELLLESEYDAQLEQLHKAHTDRMSEIDAARLNAQLSMWGGGFNQMAADLQSFADAFGIQNKKMFAVMKAAAVAGAIIDTYKAATSAYTSLAGIPYVGPALGAAAAAAAVAAGMGRVAQIKAQNISGGRRSGGVVSSGQFYKVNEGGRPEIFQGADGSQYMMPTQNGDVISNQNAQKGGGVNVGVVVNLNEDKSRAGQVNQSTDDQERTVIDIFVSDIMGDGRSASVIQNKWGLSPQGI